MAKFILIDHSITDFGGHHYEYALHVLGAAGKAGYAPILATNRGFKVDESLPWAVHPVYKYGFWAEPSGSGLSRLVNTLLSAFAQRVARLRVKLFYSYFGFFRAIQHQLHEYLGRRPVDQPIGPGLLLILGIGYLIIVARSFGMLLVSAIPFQGYFGRVFANFRDFVRVALLPVIFLMNQEEWRRWWLTDRRRVRQFGSDTRRLFEAVHLEEGDLVFIPTLSPMDMIGLLEYFRRDPCSTRATWHLLFRRNIYAGREPDYPGQDEALRPLRRAFLLFQQGLSGQKVYFYTDTQELANQYNRLVGIPFGTVPIPHTRAPAASRSPGQPLRIIYVGDARHEKGYQHLPRIVQDLWADYVETGKVVFTFQSNYNLPGGEPEAIVARSQLSCYPGDKVTVITEPLSSEEYWRTLLSGDINLLLYDRDNYYARSSGILIESLAAGIPVVVPAGTWLARQFADEVYRHHASIRENMIVVEAHSSPQLEWRREPQRGPNPMSDGIVRFGGKGEGVHCSALVPDGAEYLLITLGPTNPGVFIEVGIGQLDGRDQTVGRSLSIVGRGIEEDIASVFAPLEKGVAQITLALRNAFAHALVSVYDIKLEFLRPQRSGESPAPSAVGLIYSQDDQISDLLKDMIDNYAHYRLTAQSFAARTLERHNADRLVEELDRAARSGVASDKTVVTREDRQHLEEPSLSR